MSLLATYRRLRDDLVSQLQELGFDEDYAALAVSQVDPASRSALQLVMHWVEENPPELFAKRGPLPPRAKQHQQRIGERLAARRRRFRLLSPAVRCAAQPHDDFVERLIDMGFKRCARVRSSCAPCPTPCCRSQSERALNKCRGDFDAAVDQLLNSSPVPEPEPEPDSADEDAERADTLEREASRYRAAMEWHAAEAERCRHLAEERLAQAIELQRRADTRRRSKMDRRAVAELVAAPSRLQKRISNLRIQCEPEKGPRRVRQVDGHSDSL
jgi:hypothetical protein